MTEATNRGQTSLSPFFVLALIFLLAAGAFGQPLRVFSEFARIDATGHVTAPESPREILSPAIARNAYTSFQVVVDAPAEKSYHVYVGLNPENAVKITLYRESGDRLQPAEQPVQGKGPQVFWMDVWAERSAPVERIKIEPQLNIDDDWVIYPMEGRVMAAVVPDGNRPPGTLAPREVIKTLVCGGDSASNAKDPAESAETTVAAIRFRNAQQDLALAAKAPREDLRKLFGPCEAAAPQNPEWYFRFRDYFFKLR